MKKEENRKEKEYLTEHIEYNVYSLYKVQIPKV